MQRGQHGPVGRMVPPDATRWSPLSEIGSDWRDPERERSGG